MPHCPEGLELPGSLMGNTALRPMPCGIPVPSLQVAGWGGGGGEQLSIVQKCLCVGATSASVGQQNLFLIINGKTFTVTAWSITRLGAGGNRFGQR